jgi:hypothetical protein
MKAQRAVERFKRVAEDGLVSYEADRFWELSLEREKEFYPSRGE